MPKKPFWVRTGQRALGGLFTSSAAQTEVGCPYGSPSRPLALVARGELGANCKLALLLLRSVRPKGGIPDQARRLALARFSECPFCYELQARVRVPACGETATRSHGAAPAQECRLRLKRLPPVRETPDGSLQRLRWSVKSRKGKNSVLPGR